MKKFLALLLAVMTFAGAVAPASAVTIEELLAQIAALQAQLVALQTQQPSSSGVCLTKDLYFGMTDAQVKVLQGWLGVSPQSGWFGSLTKAAVVKYQQNNSISPAAGYVGPLTRGSMNAKYCQASSTSTPSAPGSVSVGLSPVNPAGTSIIADSTSADGAQAMAEVAVLRFSASATGAVKVTKVVLHRAGVSADSDVSNLYLYVDGVRVGEYPSISSGYFTFTNSAGLFSVPAGSYKDVVVKMDLANGTSAGKTFQFGVMAAGDVSSDATSVAGSFPMHGNIFTVAQVSDLGKMTLSSALPSSSASVDAGTLNYEVFRFSTQMADQKGEVRYVKFTLVGTADYDALQNLKLYVDGVQVGSAVAMMNSDKTVVFDLSGAPVTYTAG